MALVLAALQEGPRPDELVEFEQLVGPSHWGDQTDGVRVATELQEERMLLQQLVVVVPRLSLEILELKLARVVGHEKLLYFLDADVLPRLGQEKSHGLVRFKRLNDVNDLFDVADLFQERPSGEQHLDSAAAI